MMNNRKHSLYFTLGLVIVLTVVTVMSIHATFTYRLSKEKVMNEMDEHASSTIIALEKNIVNMMAAYSLNEYDRLVLTEMEHHDNFAIIVEDDNMGKIFGMKTYVSGKIRDPQQNIVDYDPKNTEHNKRLSECLYSKKYDIKSANGEKLGSLRIYITDYMMNKELNSIILSSVINTIVISLVLILALFTLIRLVVLKPLSDMIQGITACGEDGLPLEAISNEGASEIFLLADTMNTMISSVRSSNEAFKEQQNQTNELKERLELAWDGVNDGVWDWHIAKNIVHFSSKWKSMLGYMNDDLTESPNSFFTLIHEDDQERIAYLLKEHFKNPDENPYSAEIRMKCKDGSYKWILTRGKAILDSAGNPMRMVGSHTDISEQKVLQENLLRSNEEAIKANKAKSEFLANMSHEIRTPLNGVMGLISLLFKTDLTQQQQEYVSKAHQSSKALLNVLNDILDYSKIEAGKLTFEKRIFSVESLLCDVSALFDYAMHEKSLDMHIDIDSTIPSYLKGDSLRLSQIFNNLVGNAIKFTENGDITIRVKPLEETPTEVTLLCSVTDTGIGMSDEEQKLLFRPFSQTDNSNTRKYGGTGLGLSISKQLIELMNGKIWVESSKGEGSRFFFTVHFEKENSVNAPTVSIGHIKEKEFLVVDDSDLEREMVGNILNSWGANTTLCSSGSEALARISQYHYDYMIVDWQMPGMDGLEVLKSLEKDPKNNFPKVIMVTAHLKENLIQAAVSQHITLDRVLNKPVTSSKLYESLLETMTSHPLPDEVKSTSLSMNGKILLVEDNEINQLVATDMLKAYGLDVRIAINGEIAVQMAKNEHFDLILMDLQMPVMDGFKSSMIIREFNQTIPIIALSAAVMEKDKELTASAGMNGHLAKPIESDALEEILITYLETQWSSNDVSLNADTLALYGIDKKALSSKIKNPKTQEKFLKIFANTHRDFPGLIRNTPVESELFNRMIHTLKGVSGNMAAMKLYDITKQISDTEDIATKKALIELLLEELNKIICAIDGESSFVQRVYHPISREESQAMIDRLIEKLTNHEFVSDQDLDDFFQMLPLNINDDMIETMKNAMDEFNYEIALGTLKSIQKYLK